ncbi:SDR family oxidoreductase [Halieaceae bacterium IMCC14734]|uniref:SDR family oxidoreductase n=1 Tax=Candidatus Litorirhabdus singularis TaxID=2518993 RepID=A0ABT3TEU2_9GAMM|nr:SDR family oxidoreductase [Candidatus Litorirhabdus singularis]MCX2980524.1 SDR family oxidoreductase [Candidatus Litorirhabdus singularis]
MDQSSPNKVLIAGATGYLGKYAVKAFKQRGFWVRTLTRDKNRLFEPGPFTAPALKAEDIDDIFVGKVTEPDTLVGLMDGIDTVYSSIGISRQRDGLSFEQVDYQANRNLIDLCLAANVKRFVYVSMQGAENIMQLEITQVHERVVEDLKNSGMEYRIVRPCGYFSDMGALYDMAKRGRALLVGAGENRMSPIHGQDLAEVCVDTLAGSALEVEAGGPDILTQREAAMLAFEVVGKPVKITVIPMWLARGLVKFVGLLSNQFGDLADFIVTAGEIDGVGPPLGKTTLRSYFEMLHAEDQQKETK